MQTTFDKYLLPLLVTLISTAVLVIIRIIAFRLFHRWAEKTETKLDDIIIASFRKPSLLLAVAVGLHIGVYFSEIPPKYVSLVGKALEVIIILSVTMAAAGLAGMLFRHYVQKSNIPIPTTGLAYGMLKGVIYLIGILVILTVLGISIAPLITALGVGGLAVALALQDTLSNLFAGIHILVEKSIRVGDFIRLETGQEGRVDDITWRTTRVRMQPNNMVVIPNSKLAQSVVTNYSLPEQRMALLIPVGVSYEADPDAVERILLEETRQATGAIPGLLAEPVPVVRFIPGFGESSLDFTLTCHVKEYSDQNLVQHEMRKRIFKRFKQENIEIPYPQRTLYIREEKGKSR